MFKQITARNYSRLHTRARKLAKQFGIRWAASFLMAHGYPIERTMLILLGK